MVKTNQVDLVNFKGSVIYSSISRDNTLAKTINKAKDEGVKLENLGFDKRATLDYNNTHNTVTQKAMNVLILEDNLSVAELVRTIAEEQGHQAEIFTSLEEATGAFLLTPDDFDFVIADNEVMPNGVNELEICHKRKVMYKTAGVRFILTVAKKLCPDIPCAILSGYVTDDLLEKCSRIPNLEVHSKTAIDSVYKILPKAA